ncbi:MAG TPA: hypothetical protein VGK10_02790 [Prolixibacteraceae bacterium]|jgi:hypothetical protein
MSNQSISTLSFVFDNQTDHLLMMQITQDGPLKRKHTGIKASVDLMESMNQAAIRSIQASSGLVVPEVLLRGVIKTIQSESQSSEIYFIYEASRFSGELAGHPSGRFKWVDILNIFNLPMESLVQNLMPYLLDGESFFEGTIHLNAQDEVEQADIHICNTI